jgi:Icc-related predicted phosphoesterase
MRLQIFSDIHLEFGPMEAPATDADVIIAAGDIDQQTDGVEWLKSLEKPVIYVAGNHEIWGGDLHASIDELRDACAGSNIHFLERNQVTIGEVTFFGCSMWTDFDGDRPEILNYAKYYMNDFSYIGHNGGKLKPAEVSRLHHESAGWLRKALSRATDRKQVVVTHHAPSLRSWGFEPDDPLRFVYCNQFDEWLRDSGVALWVHGHVHCRSDYRVRRTRVVCNPRGYYRMGLVDEFDAGKIVEI